MTTNHEMTPVRRSVRGLVLSTGASCLTFCTSLVMVSTTSTFLLLGSLLTTIEVAIAAEAGRRARQRQREARLLLSEHAALRRATTLVTSQCSPDQALAALTREAGDLLDLDVLVVLRDEGDGVASMAGVWSRLEPTPPLGTTWTTTAGVPSAAARWTRQPSRLGDIEIETVQEPVRGMLRRVGARWSLARPILVKGQLWGVAVGGSQVAPATEAGRRLDQFTELVAYAVAHAGARQDLAASRARIVASGIHARRRIERDLHDGVQQRLVSLGLAVHRAETLAAPDHVALREHLAEMRADLRAALDELREVAHGIHPSILSEGGLGPALSALARRSGVPVDIVVRGHRRMPDEIELCLYYVASEALTNAVKHAQASCVEIELDLEGSTVRLAVRDDGLGGADACAGSGLVGLSDRVQALGGAVQVDSPAGHGTRLEAKVPCPLLPARFDAAAEGNHSDPRPALARRM